MSAAGLHTKSVRIGFPPTSLCLCFSSSPLWLYFYCSVRAFLFMVLQSLCVCFKMRNLAGWLKGSLLVSQRGSKNWVAVIHHKPFRFHTAIPCCELFFCLGDFTLTHQGSLCALQCMRMWVCVCARTHTAIRRLMVIDVALTHRHSPNQSPSIG